MLQERVDYHDLPKTKYAAGNDIEEINDYISKHGLVNYNEKVNRDMFK